MTRTKDIYELFSIWSPHKRISYAINGILMGLGAPLGWLLIDTLLFRPPEFSVSAFIVNELTHSLEKSLLFLYMSLGTSLVMSITGYLVGRGFDWNAEKAEELEKVHSHIEEQKKEFEHRFHRLHSDMSNLYKISANIQKSLKKEQVLQLIADGAQHVLNFDRINIFLVDKDKKNLACREARGHEGESWREIRIPLTEEAGMLHKAFRENKVHLVPDIAKMPSGSRLEPPLSRIPELRSRSFACIPLRERGEPIGLITVDNKYRKTPVRDEKLSTLQILVDQGSVALTNISLFQGINNLHHELEQNFEVLLNRKEQFSTIVRSLSLRAEDISQSVHQVAKNTEGLYSTVDETASSVQQMSGSLDEVAAAVKNLFDESEKTASSTAQMGTSIREVETSARESNLLSEQVKREAEEGASLVQESIRGIGRIQDIVLTSVEGMKRFGQKIEEISDALEVINNINEKTNVLALNAAIISSQAGAHGKGFEVVSNEIRGLSEQTAASSKEIEKMIESIQGEVRKSVTMVQSIPEHVEAGVKLSRKSGEALNQILKSSITSLGMSQQIQTATQEQVNSTEVVSRALKSVNEMIQKITASINEQNQGGRTIAQANENMRGLTAEVKQNTEKQAEGFQAMAQMVREVSTMVDTLFAEAEKRKEESEFIVESIDAIETKKSTA